MEYGQAGGTVLRLDAQAAEGKGPFPVVILVHGGGWSAGDKSGSNVPGDGADITPWFSLFHNAGYSWFSINYRLAPANRWPACIDDLDTAIVWVKKHAAQFGGDPARVILVGHSAGGHLVCYAGTHPLPGTEVQAVVGCAPVTDLVADSQQRKGLSTSLQWLFGLPKPLTPEALIQLRPASPIEAVRPGLPPFLLVHGTVDRTVPFAMSVAFQARLRQAGDTCDLIPVEGAPHKLLVWDQKDPSYRAKLLEWLKRTVK